MKYRVALPLAGAAAAAFFMVGIVASSQVGGEPTVETRTFTHEDVVTFTVPTETVVTTETVVSTETVTVTESTTTVPPSPPATVVQPGQSWDAACDAASPGDWIQIAAGNHAAQTITCVKAAPGVTFRGEPGARIAATQTGSDDLLVHGTYLTFEDFDIYDNWYAYDDTSDLVFRNIDAQKFYVRSSDRVSIIGGTYSAPQATGVPTVSAVDTGFPPSTDVLIDGVLFERIWRPAGSSDHRECLHIMGVDGLTIRDSVFRECLGNTSALSFNIHHSSRIEGVLVEGNLFEGTYGGGAYPQPTGTGPSVNISDRAPGYEITFRGNAFRDSNAVVGVGHPVTPGAIRWESNCGVGPAPAVRDWTWVSNTWNLPTCGAG